jgi:xanthine dehydrogenase YagS FAD-binding subunit
MSFEWASPLTLDEAFEFKREGADWLAGGTDLLPEFKSGLAAPARLVNLKRIPELRGIQLSPQGVRIGALTTLAEMAAHPLLQSRYRALAQACDLSASPQIRNVATIGGNLNQASRCPYYRNGWHCVLRGGTTCFMREGENREAAVIGYRECVHVHPSDPAVALVALNAQLVLQGREGEQIVDVAEFWRAPDRQDHRLNLLAPGQVITALLLPEAGAGARSAYAKAMDRAAWGFALVSAAVFVQVRTDAAQAAPLDNVRVVLGGVAPIPWREEDVEQILRGIVFNGRAEDIEAIAGSVTRVLAKAQPFAHNRYKLRLARGMIQRALRECLA